MNFMDKMALLFLFACLAAAAGLPAQCAEDWVVPQWSSRIPGDLYGANAPFQVSVDRDGNTYMAGYAADSLFLSSTDGAVAQVVADTDSSFQLALSKYSPEGELLWARGFSVGPLSSFAPDVQAVGEKVAVCGSFYQTLRVDSGEWDAGPYFGGFVVLLDEEGNVEWTKVFNGAGDCYVHGLSSGPGGSLFITGRFTGEVDAFGFSSGGFLWQNHQSFVAKMNPDGAIAWAVQSGPQEGSGHDSRGNALIVEDGDVITGGFFSDSICWGGSCLSSGRNSGRTPYIVRLDGTTGAIQWLRGAVAPPQGYPNGALYGLAADGAGNIFGAGYIQSPFIWSGAALEPSGNFENLLMCWGEDGTLKWSRTFGSDKPGDVEWATSVMVTGYRTLLVIANIFPGTEIDGMQLPSFGKGDLAILEFTLSGKYLRNWVAGGSETEFSYGAALGPDGALLVCGNSLSEKITFRSGEVTQDTALWTNSFLQRLCLNLAPEGSHPEEDIVVFPNPVRGVCWVEGDFGEEPLSIAIVNALGQAVGEYFFPALPGRNRYPVNMGELSPGVYYLQLAGERGGLFFSVPVVLHR